MEKGHLISRLLTGAEAPDLSAFNPILQTFQHLKDVAPNFILLGILGILATIAAIAIKRSVLSSLRTRDNHMSWQDTRRAQEPLFIRGQGHRREFGD